MLITLVGALIIGLTLGMLGSGGSAITVPMLIYFVGHGTKESIAESMAIVGLISIFAAIPYARANQIEWRTVWCFGVPGMLGTYIGAWLGGVSSEPVQLVVFAVVLIAAAYSMLNQPAVRRNKGSEVATHDARPPIALVATQGMVVGSLTGFVGVGGGFLIVPALVLLGRLPMRLAIGTSLVIIVFNAIIGFAKYEHYLMSHDTSVNLPTIIAFAVIGIVGSMFGRSINARLNQNMLRQVFACFLILLGSFVMLHEGSKLLAQASSRDPANTEKMLVQTTCGPAGEPYARDTSHGKLSF